MSLPFILLIVLICLLIYLLITRKNIIKIKTDKKTELIKRAEAQQMSLNDYVLMLIDKESHF